MVTEFEIRPFRRWSKVKWGFQGGSVVKNLPVNTRDAGDTGSIPGSGRSPGERNGNPPMSPALAGRFCTTEPPEKPSSFLHFTNIRDSSDYKTGQQNMFHWLLESKNLQKTSLQVTCQCSRKLLRAGETEAWSEWVRTRYLKMYVLRAHHQGFLLEGCGQCVQILREYGSPSPL